MKKYISYFLITAVFISCKDEYTFCDLPTVVQMKCVFYQNNNGIISEASAPFLTVTKLTSPNPDYALPMLSNFSLALNPITDSVQYQVSIQTATIPDTVTFVYSTQIINVSPLCGDVNINNLLRVSTTINTLDSVKISGSSVNTTPVENVRIYF